MPWFKKDEPDTPAELRDLTPEQIIAKIKDADRLAAEAEANKTALQSKDAELATARQKITELETPPRRTDPEEPVSIWADPEKAISERMAPTTAIAVHAGKIAARMAARQSMKPDDNRIFTKYEAEIVKLVDSYPPNQQVMPEAWAFALNQIKGIHFEEIMKAKSENSDFFSEVPGNSPPPPPEKKDQLSDEELRICKRMNITPERYMAQKKAMVINNA